MLHTRLPYGDGRHVPEKLSHVRFSVQPLSPHHPPSFVLCSVTWQSWRKRMCTSPDPLAVDVHGPPTGRCIIHRWTSCFGVMGSS